MIGGGGLIFWLATTLAAFLFEKLAGVDPVTRVLCLPHGRRRRADMAQMSPKAMVAAPTSVAVGCIALARVAWFVAIAHLVSTWGTGRPDNQSRSCKTLTLLALDGWVCFFCLSCGAGAQADSNCPTLVHRANSGWGLCWRLPEWT